MIKLIAGLALVATLAAGTDAGCDVQAGHKGNGTAATDIVQDKKVTSKVGIKTYRLCLGATKAGCSWYRITGRADNVDYRHCSIGEHFPKCTYPGS